MAPTLKQITPFVPVSDIDRSIRFFEDVLGFRATNRMADYAYVRRDSVALRLVSATPNKNLHDPNSQVHCYIDVVGIDHLYALLKPQLDQLPTGRVKPPFNTSYGQREFHVIDEDVLLISFGEQLMG